MSTSDSDRPGPDAPLSEAREWLLAAREAGTDCPCCGQHCRVYRRRLNYAMAHTLVLVYQHFLAHPDAGWLHLPSFLNGKGVLARGGDPPRLSRWGLIVGSGAVRDDDSGRVGEYKLTDKGRAFVERRVAVPSHVLIYNNTVLGWSDEQIYIDAALGKGFNYAELMAGMTRRRAAAPKTQTCLFGPDEPPRPLRRRRRS